MHVISGCSLNAKAVRRVQLVFSVVMGFKQCSWIHNQTIIIATFNQLIVGVLGFELLQQKTDVWLHSICVMAMYRRKGLAQGMIRKLLQHLHMKRVLVSARSTVYNKYWRKRSGYSTKIIVPRDFTSITQHSPEDAGGCDCFFWCCLTVCFVFMFVYFVQVAVEYQHQQCGEKI